jgi:hypothetical protein
MEPAPGLPSECWRSRFRRSPARRGVGWKGGGDPHKVSQRLPHLAEIEGRIQALNEAEHVASGAGLTRQSVGIPPSLTVVIDDHDLAGAAAILKCPAGAFGFVECPSGRQPFEDGGAAHGCAQPLDFVVVSAHRSSLLFGIQGR